MPKTSPSSLNSGRAAAAPAAGPATPTSTDPLATKPRAPASESPGPSSAPGATADTAADLALYARIEGQVEQLRQLTPKLPITPVLLDEQGVRDWMTKATQTGVDHQALAAESRLLIHLGMLPAGSSIEQLELDELARVGGRQRLQPQREGGHRRDSLRRREAARACTVPGSP